MKRQGVPRSSFYKLFADKYAVSVWYQQLIYRAGTALIGIHYTWADGVYVTTSGVELLKPLLRSSALAAADSGYTSTPATGTRDREQEILHVLRDVRHVPLTDRLRYLVSYCARAEIVASADWVMRNDLPDIRTWCEWLAACVPAELRAAMEPPVDPWLARELDLGTIAQIAGAEAEVNA